MPTIPMLKTKAVAIWLGGILMAGYVLAQTIKTGPAVGEKVPAFSAQDQEGRPETQQSIVGPRGAMLVFFRSADW
jgi:hypothetical protein